MKLFHKKDIFEAITFDPISRLKKHDAVYYKVQAFYETKPSKPVLFQFNLKSISSCGYMVDHFPKSSRETDNFTFSSDLSDSDADPENPAQPRKSIRFNACNQKAGFVGKTISFNTGAKYRKSLGCGLPNNLRANFLKFGSPNDKNVRDINKKDAIITSSTQVHLPFLVQKTTI